MDGRATLSDAIAETTVASATQTTTVTALWLTGRAARVRPGASAVRVIVGSDPDLFNVVEIHLRTLAGIFQL
jgi:hypothetical protein